MEYKLIVTGDGSHSIYLPELNETYHSVHGAVQESDYVFVQQGLSHFLASNLENNHISILEIGFGTGLNALLSYQYSLKHDLQIHFETLEPFPIPVDLSKALNYVPVEDTKLRHIFDSLHSLDFSQELHIGNFSFIKHLSKLEDFKINPKFDVIFYDAFAPSKQKEVWQISNLQKCYECLNESGFIVSYCASGQYKRDLKEAGFIVENLPGPPGKKEMTRAHKKTVLPS